MAINIWKAGGKPTAYNPFPLGIVSLGIPIYNEYTVTFKAKSASNAVFWVTSYSTINDMHNVITLTPEFKTYTFTWLEIQGGSFNFNNINNAIDIIVQDIVLVRKPLPKFTINGIDGFSSGKWALHANAKVIDDETLELNATAIDQNNPIIVNVLEGKTYTLSTLFTDVNSVKAVYALNGAGANGALLASTTALNAITFTIPVGIDRIRIYLANNTAGKFTFKRPMLNLGTSPAPYEKKRGERMVQPVVKSKNLFDGQLELNNINLSTGQNLVEAGYSRTKNYSQIEGNKNYVAWHELTTNIRFYFYDAAYNFLSAVTDVKAVSPSNAKYVRMRFATENINAKCQFEEGTTATPYTPYEVQLNKKPKRKIVTKRVITSKRNLEARR